MPSHLPPIIYFVAAMTNLCIRQGYLLRRTRCCVTSLLLLHPAFSFVGRTATFVRPRRALRADIVDVDFVPVDRGSSSRKAEQTNKDLLSDERPKSLFDLSLEADPDFLETRIPFVDNGGSGTGGVSCIDVKLAFMAELDNVQYGIGIPFDAVVALTLEKEDGSVQYLSPDLDENEELMEIMAGQLKEQLGDNFRLMRTPRVLTITGPLDEYTKDWKTKLVPKSIQASELMSKDHDDEEEELAAFHKFMRDELGDEEYEKTLNEPPDDELKELMKLFEIPGLGTKIGDKEGVDEMLASLMNPQDDFDKAKEALGATSLDHEGVAIKLISYVFAWGKSYSLVKLLNPYAIVGRYVADEKSPRFELLSPSEEQIVLPRLEQVCKQDLELAGLQLKE
jgi:hypothetical protein